MPYKDLAKQRAAQRQWYAKNKGGENPKRQLRKHGLQQWWQEYKKRFCCSRCGESHPACIEFHHLDPKNKRDGVSLLLFGGCSKATVLQEVARCTPLCANCHRKEHYKEQNGPTTI